MKKNMTFFAAGILLGFSAALLLILILDISFNYCK